MVVLFHPAPTRRVQHTVAALRRANLLRAFWVLSGAGPKLVWKKDDLPNPGGRHGEDPECDGNPSGPGRSGEDAVAFDDPAPAHEERGFQLLDRLMGSRLTWTPFNAVYAYENGAAASFRAAAELGAMRIYDLPFGNRHGTHPVLAEEAAAKPEWAATLGLRDARAANFAATDAELYEADLVFVSSTFALRTLEETTDIPGAAVIAPPGPGAAPVCHLSGAVTTARSGRLRVLYVGPLSQRGGLSYAFEACRKLGTGVVLTIVGPPPASSCGALERELARVRWLPESSSEVIERELATNDVLLLPAVFDPRTEVPLRALAAGLPIVTTPNAAAADFVRDGRDGFIVPIRSADALAAKLELLRATPGLRAVLSASARRQAHAFSWGRYEAILTAAVSTALTQRGQPALV